MLLSNEQFLLLLGRHVPSDERLLVSEVPGDPADAPGEVWNVRPWKPGADAPDPRTNTYVCVSSFKRGERGFRRTSDLFGRALAFMVDDVRTKVPLEVVARLEPTIKIETSPGNEQWWYLFREPIKDPDLFQRLIGAFVRQRLNGEDPGMGGANRVARLPQGINGKAKYRTDGRPWHVRTLSVQPERLFTLENLLVAFDLRLEAARPKRINSATVSPEDIAARRAEFEDLKKHLTLLKQHANYAGRIPILCPWVHLHTNGARTGTYLVEPNERNDYWGSYVCFHSTTHADDCHLRQLKRWADEQIEAELSAVLRDANSKAPADVCLV